MANWSESEIILNGERMTEAYEDLKRYLDKEQTLLIPKAKEGVSETFGYSCVEINEITFEANEFKLTGSGRWSAPYNYIKALVLEYGLSGTYHDMESGCNFYHQMIFKDGECIEDEESQYFSSESIKYVNDVEYWINHCDYIPSDKNWEESYKREITLFAEMDVSLEDLKKYWLKS